MRSVSAFALSAAAIVLLCAGPALALPLTAAASNADATPSPASRNLARQVLVASGADASSVVPSEATMAQALAALSRALPTAKPDWRPVMEQAVRDEFKAYAARLFDSEVIIYASHLTQAQLADILAFYSTPSGKALAAQSAAIEHDRQAVSRRMGADLMPHMIAAVCAKEACPPTAPAAKPQASGR